MGPVVGPTNQSHVSYTIDHSYGAVVAVRLRDAWLQSDCDLTDSVADIGDPERGVRNDGRFGTYNDPVAGPDEQACKHRFYGDEWNVTAYPVDPMHTQVVVRRIDADLGWAYDGLRVEYTVCGQDKTGRVTQGQGLWRPTLGLLNPVDGQLQRDWDGCKFLRTAECSPGGHASRISTCGAALRYERGGRAIASVRTGARRITRAARATRPSAASKPAACLRTGYVTLCGMKMACAT